jgi:hypothetical protein
VPYKLIVVVAFDLVNLQQFMMRHFSAFDRLK